MLQTAQTSVQHVLPSLLPARVHDVPVQAAPPQECEQDVLPSLLPARVLCIHGQAKGWLCKTDENISIDQCYACVHIGTCPAQIHSHCMCPSHRSSMHVRIRASTVMQGPRQRNSLCTMTPHSLSRKFSCHRRLHLWLICMRSSTAQNLKALPSRTCTIAKHGNVPHRNDASSRAPSASADRIVKTAAPSIPGCA